MTTTELDQAIERAFATEGKQEDVNKVYLALLRANLFVPTSKEKSTDPEEPFQPLFAEFEGNYFLPAFDTVERLITWAGEEFGNIEYVELPGIHLITGMSDEVFLCLNLGCPFYKEFLPDEVKQLKKIAARINQLK